LGFINWPVILLHQLCPSSFLAPSSPRHQRISFLIITSRNIAICVSITLFLLGQSRFICPRPPQVKHSMFAVDCVDAVLDTPEFGGSL
jgi:hypothetical protein